MTERTKANNYLKHLDKWQASSHPELSNRKPEQLFEAEFVDRYNRLHKDLWSRIIRVHGTLYTLDQLKEFPFDYLYAPDGMEFWHLVVENFLDVACLLLHGLVRDESRDAHTIPRFKNQIMTALWLDHTKHELFQQTLRDRKFDKGVKSIADRLEEIRNHRLAHRLVESQNARTNEEPARISFDELWKLFNATHARFGALSFGSAYTTLAGDLMPGTVGGKPTRTCLEEVLDAVLRDSWFGN